MARFVNFEEARHFALRQDRLTAGMLMQGLGATATVAGTLLQRLEREGIVGPVDPQGTHRVLGSTAPRRSWSPAPAGAAGTRGTVADLEAELARLRPLAEAAEAWRQRALEAEAQLGLASASSGDVQARVAALRRMLARELHPDAAPRHGVDRASHAEIFKTLWPRIEAVLRG